MPKGELTCKTGLKKNIIKKQVFKRELALCKKLSKANGGNCGWGVCKDCGVIPFLYKLHLGVLLEDPREIAKVRKNEIGL